MENYECDLLSLLELSDDYIKHQINLRNQLSEAFFQMTIARKNFNQGYITVENSRLELEASVVIDDKNERCLLKIAEDSNDSLLNICGMPPPALRKSQKEFIKSIRSIAILADDSRQISNLVLKLQSEEIDQVI
eukprot:gene10136-13635_t